jgi:CHASE2 domain-containing sensor protein
MAERPFRDGELVTLATLTRWAGVLGVGLCVGAAVCAARAAGWLEWADLRLYDAVVAARAGAGADAPIALVRIREQEIGEYGHPLPDSVLARAIERIASAKPRAIGVDVYRDVAVGGADGRAALAALAARWPGLVFVEKLAEPGVPGVAAPDFARPDSIAFNDVVTDTGGMLRRGILMLWDDEGNASLALGLRLALHHLRADGIALAPIRTTPTTSGSAPPPSHRSKRATAAIPASTRAATRCCSTGALVAAASPNTRSTTRSRAGSRPSRCAIASRSSARRPRA